MVVLSLFDGMSCGQISLRELGVSVSKYYSSEIDKFAIAQTTLNFPNTIQLGDVTKWGEWDINWSEIDLILAGSPCQGFSLSGKHLAFDDPRSRLFFTFINILNHTRKSNPDVLFLLENVNMKKDHMAVISEYAGVIPVNINSNLVSAQNRNRWYWTNIRTKTDESSGKIRSDIPQPDDRHIFICDILEKEVDAKYYLSPKALGQATNNMSVFITAMRGRPAPCSSGSEEVKNKPKNTQRLESRLDGKTNALTTVQKDNLVALLSDRRRKNLRDINGKADAFLACSHKESSSNGMTLVNDLAIRRLTPTECARLQTIPDWYKWSCSDTQQYKMLGNGWTVEVIKHILSFMPKHQ